MEKENHPGPDSSPGASIALGPKKPEGTNRTTKLIPSSSVSSNPFPTTKKRPNYTETSSAVKEDIYEATDDSQLLAIFPEELWTLILNFVTDSTAFSNVCNSSLFFRKILAPRRANLLFPKVWDVLGMKYEDETYYHFDLPPEDDSSWVGVQVTNRLGIKHFLNVPLYRDILSTRLVCRTWNVALDYFYQNDTDHYYMKADPNMKKLQAENDWETVRSAGAWSIFLFQPQDHAMVTKFLEHFEQTHSETVDVDERSPFIGRSITLRSKNRDEYFGIRTGGRYAEQLHDDHAEEYLAAITSLLMKYGHHIWYCTIDFEDIFSARRDYYLQIKEWLELLPNLKALSVIYSKMEMQPLEPYRQLMPVNVHSKPNELTQFKRVISTDPLPRMTQLEFLYMRDVPNPLFHEFVLQGDPATMLEIKRDKNFPRWNYDISLTPLNNLTQLSLEIFKEEELALLEASDGNWKLTKLYLSLKHCPYLPWPRIFKMLETKWGNTLTNVMLKLPKADKKKDENEIMKKCSQYELNLPLVKRFKVTMYNISSGDFILPMKNSMEWFDVVNKSNTGERGKITLLETFMSEKQKIKLLGYCKNLLESNIWSLLPQLKRVDVITAEIYTFYTRNQWIREMEELKSKTVRTRRSYTPAEFPWFI